MVNTVVVWLHILYIIYAYIIHIETELGDYQSGFRSTIDNIFMIMQIIEKCYEYYIDIHNIYIDYTHAFDLTKRNKILDSLIQYKIPPKLIRLVKLTLENTTAKVKVHSVYTSEFGVESGVKQGDALCATLFSLVIDSIKEVGCKRQHYHAT